MRSARRLLLAAASGAVLLSVGLGAPALAQAPAAASAQAAQPSSPWAQAASDVPADPAVRFGQLPNGMRYALMRNATPPGQASIRLRIDAGSLMENEDQLGLAHFAEHMVFNGTKNIPETEMLRILERLGLAFGADANAFTSFEQTAYMLELPNTNEETVDTSLTILREMMGDALMDGAAIDAERGVIVGEERTRNTPELRVLKAQLGLLAPGQRLSQRLPIGDLEVIRNAPRERFVEFYDAYYRPSRATLIMAGDFDVDAMEAKVRSTFADWTAKATDGPEPDLGAVQPREPETAIQVEPGVQSSIQLNWIKNPDLSPDTAEKRVQNIRRSLGLAVLNRRLGEIARADNPPFLGAGGSYQQLFNSLDIGVLGVAFNPGEWRPALERAEQEQRRLVQYGVTQAELDREITANRAGLETAVASAATRSTPALANALLGAVNDDRVFTTPAENLALFNRAVEGLTADQVTTAAREVFAGQGPLVLFTSPVAVEGGEQAVTDALNASRETTVAAPAAQAALEWPYADFGTAGVAGPRSEIADLGVTQVSFPNGVRLIVKPTDFRDQQILINVQTGVGEMGLPTDRVTAASLADAVMAPGGLGKLTVDEMNRVLAGRIFSRGVSQGTDAYSFSGATRPEDLELQMQILTASLTDPGLRAAPFQQIKSLFPQILAQAGSTPGGAFGLRAGELLASGDKREATPTVEEVAAMTIEDLRAGVLAGTSTGPIDITVVGDVTVDAAVEAVAKTFGALPARPELAAPLPGSDQRRFPAPTTEPVRLTHTGQADQALAYVAWPTTDAVDDRTEARRLSILSDVLQLRLNEEIREKLAIAYSPSSGASSSNDFKGYGSISAVAEVKPEDIARLYEALDAIAADLRDNPISEDELNRARRPAVEQLRRQQADNGYWLGQLSGLHRKPTSVEDIRSHLADLEAVTATDLQALAQKYLRPDTAWRATVTAAGAEQ